MSVTNPYVTNFFSFASDAYLRLAEGILILLVGRDGLAEQHGTIVTGPRILGNRQMGMVTVQILLQCNP